MSLYGFLKETLTSKEWASTHFITPFERKMLKNFNIIKAHILNIIDERIKSRTPETKNVDVLDFYVEALLNQKKNDKGPEITKDEIVEQFFAVSFAATDTTGNWTAMMMYCLAKNPQVYEKVRAEIDGLVDNLDDLDYDILKNKLTYSWAFL